MNIYIEYSSALAGETSYVEVRIPPFEPRERDPGPLVRSWNEKSGESAREKREIEEFALTQEQVAAISDAVKAIRITPSGGSFNLYRTCDGWSTKLALDACDSKVILEWFLHPPPEWIGVRELCGEINRIPVSLKRSI